MRVIAQVCLLFKRNCLFFANMLLYGMYVYQISGKKRGETDLTMYTHEDKKGGKGVKPCNKSHTRKKRAFIQ